MTNSNRSAVPEAFRDELQQFTTVQKALSFLKSPPPKVWREALADYRAAAWSYQTAFSTHMAHDVAMRRQHLEELAARAARFVPGMATQDLQTSVDDARKNLAAAETLLNANPNESARIERAAQRSANSRRLQEVVSQVTRMRLGGEKIDDALLYEVASLESLVSQDRVEAARETAAMTKAGAEIAAARAAAVSALVEALREEIVACVEQAARILEPRAVVYAAFPKSIPGTALACWNRASEIEALGRQLDGRGFDLEATFLKVLGPKAWGALRVIVMRRGPGNNVASAEPETEGAAE